MRLAGHSADDRRGTPALPPAPDRTQASGQAMSTPGRQGLIARVRQIRRTFPTAATAPTVADTRRDLPEVPEVQTVEARVAHLEQLVQGLQDAMYRESQRQDKRIEELEARVEPAALAVALSKDARDRGL
jgi:hypothetical protein